MLHFSECFAVALLLLGAIPAAAAEGDLPRHGVIGLQVAADPAQPAGPANPVTVARVLPGSAGEAAGFQTGDEIVSVDGQPIERTDQFVRAIGRHLAGQAAAVAIRHGGDAQVRTAVLKPRPFETAPGVDVVYQSVTVRGLRRRVILTHPQRPGRLPALLLVGGLGCYSLDGTDRKTGYGRILSAFEEKGFVTLRVEKTGEGDSEGPPCTDPSVMPDVEAEGYLVAAATWWPGDRRLVAWPVAAAGGRWRRRLVAASGLDNSSVWVAWPRSGGVCVRVP